MAKSKSFVPNQHPVRRNVTLSHSDDDVEFNALPLPNDLPNAAPAGKGISKIVNWIIEPEVKLKGAVATTFGPPITVTADFNSQDVVGAPRAADGKPRISLFTAWKQGNVWKWEKLATTVDCADKECTRGTLTARISNLHPNDPIGDGFD